jgi:hypothetical protein
VEKTAEASLYILPNQFVMTLSFWFIIPGFLKVFSLNCFCATSSKMDCKLIFFSCTFIL